MKLNSVALIVVIMVFVSTSNAAELKPGDKVSAAKNAANIVVDLVKGTIGDVNYRSDVSEIESQIGSKRIKKSTEYLEGDESDVYLIDVKGHTLQKHWNATSFTDPAFKMLNGISIGSTIKQFKKNYGEGEMVGGEGTSWCFKSNTPKYYFCLKTANENYDDDNLVTGIWVW